jgi:hypothetical protein
LGAHRDEVLDPPWNRRPSLVDDAERRTSPDALGDPQRDEVVDLIELDPLPRQLLADAPQGA